MYFLKIMKLRIEILCFFLILIAVQLNSQQFVPCLYDIVVQQREESNPGYKQALYRAIEDAAKESHLRNDEIYTIKVVFHVVYKTEEENIHDSLLVRQIARLNRDYRRQNADTINLREVFHPVAADARIEFELNEIRRVQTTKTFRPSLTGLPDQVKQTANGGSDAKDPDHYLNIWICKIEPLTFLGLESPVLGYAYPPDALSHWPAGSAAPAKELEGVVIDYRAVRDDSYYIKQLNNNIPMLGRTTVHEVGHYLGLRHISGDAGILGVNCEGNDGVDDTPTQGMQSQFDCNKEQNTCGAGEPGDLPDMVENYMDYSSEDCQNTFTKGQVAIMRSVLTTLRKGLIEDVSGTDDVKISDIALVPNPTTGYFSIKNTSDVIIHSLEIMDTRGRIIQQFNSGFDGHFTLGDLGAGLYFVRINHQITKKLVIANP